MKSNEWADNFRLAYEAYTLAQYGNELREKAALTFIQWISNFKDGGFPANERLELELLGQDLLRRNAAAYILIEVAKPERLAKLSESMTLVDNNFKVLSDVLLKRLWIASPPKNGRELFWEWHLNNIHAQTPLLESLLTKPTALAYYLAEEILSSGHSKLSSKGVANYFGETVLRHFSAWGQTDLLQAVLEHPPIEPSFMSRHGNTDLRLEAAFYLGLVGNRRAISFLESQASGDDEFQAVYACIRLSLLAQPSVIEKLKPLLASEDGNIVGTALSAVLDIKAIDLIPDLLDLANREVYCDLFSEPVCDDALRDICAILGEGDIAPPQERYAKGTYGTFGGTYTYEYRQDAIKYYADLSKQFEGGLRYQEGELVSLKLLANNLSNPHSGPFENAVFNLTAITGQQYPIVLDPFHDFIANVKAIRLWKDYATHSTVLKPGGWAYQGQPLYYP